jgi:hypothetical protein
MKKEKDREDMERCRYVFRKFPKNTLLGPIRYQDLYNNDSQTTFYSLEKERAFCEDKLMGMVMDIIVYFIIFIWFLHTLRYPMP